MAAHASDLACGAVGGRRGTEEANDDAVFLPRYPIRDCRAHLPSLRPSLPLPRGPKSTLSRSSGGRSLAKIKVGSDLGAIYAFRPSVRLSALASVFSVHLLTLEIGSALCTSGQQASPGFRPSQTLSRSRLPLTRGKRWPDSVGSGHGRSRMVAGCWPQGGDSIAKICHPNVPPKVPTEYAYAIELVIEKYYKKGPSFHRWSFQN